MKQHRKSGSPNPERRGKEQLKTQRKKARKREKILKKYPTSCSTQNMPKGNKLRMKSRRDKNKTNSR